MPAPAGAITVLLPLYLDRLGLFDVRTWPWLIALYTLAMAVLLVSTIPTFSGKLLGERISREYVLPAFVGVAALVALLVTYPYGTLALVTVLYLATFPISYRRFQLQLQQPAPAALRRRAGNSPPRRAPPRRRPARRRDQALIDITRLSRLRHKGRKSPTSSRRVRGCRRRRCG